MARTPEYFMAAENAPDGRFTSPQEISKPGIDDDEAGKYQGNRKPRFGVRPAGGLGPLVGGRLKA